MADATPASDTGLRFGLLGSFQVERWGQPVDCGGLKQRAVLALLAVNANRPLSTERMIDELWREQPPPTAVATLQAYVSNLRKSLEPDRPARSPASVVVSRSGSYELAVQPDQVDSLRFERLAADGARCLADDPARASALLTEALELWRGPALVELAAYEFATSEIMRLDELRITARESRIEADLALGQGTQLIAELELLVGEHPLRERLWAHLMRAYYRAGRQAEALRAYRRCEEVLADELGIAPSSELRALELAVLEQDPGLLVPHPAANGSATDRAPLRPPGIVGRTAELRAFHDAVARAERGQGSVLLLRGEPGVGKSRLIEAMRQGALDLGCRAALARCVEIGGTPPFWPWIQIVRALGPEVVTEAAGPFAPYLTPLMPDATTDRPGDSSSGHKRYLVADGLVEAMRRLGAGRPVVVLIDDLYCADPDSLSVLALVGAAVADEPVVLVGTHRLNAPRGQHPLLDVLVQLSRLEWCHRLQLPRFDRTDVGELVRLVVGDDVDADAIDAIHARTEGNAFYTVELARLLHEQPRGPGDAAPIPDTVKEVVARRLDTLAAPALTMARVAALIGRTFDLSVVAEVAEGPMSLALELADAAVAEGIIEEVEPIGHYRFSHVLVIETLVAGLGALRRAEVHDRIARVLDERFGDDCDQWDSIAHHRVEAIPIAGAEPAIEALARAGRRATAMNALALADQLLTRRHDLVMRARASPDRDRAELEALLDRSVVWTWRDGYQSEDIRLATDRMLELTQAASPDAVLDPTTETGTRHGVLPALQARCSFEIVAGNVIASRDIAQTMLELAELTGRPYLVAVANINAIVAALHTGCIDDAMAHGARTAEVMPEVDPGPSGDVTLPLGQQSLAVTHLGFFGWAQRMNGQRDLARDTLQQGRAVADRSEHAFSRAFHASIECIVAAIDGSPSWVDDVVLWAGPRHGSRQFAFLDASLDLYRTWADGMTGDPVAAATELRRAVLELERRGACVVQTLHWAMVAELELAGGRPDAAHGVIDAGLARSERFGERFWRPELLRLSAAALVDMGDRDGADAALARARTEADAMDLVAFRRQPATLAAR